MVLNVGKHATKSRLVLVLLLIGQESGIRFFNCCKRETFSWPTDKQMQITFETHWKTALMVYITTYHKL